MRACVLIDCLGEAVSLELETNWLAHTYFTAWDQRYACDREPVLLPRPGVPLIVSFLLRCHFYWAVQVPDYEGVLKVLFQKLLSFLKNVLAIIRFTDWPRSSQLVLNWFITFVSELLKVKFEFYRPHAYLHSSEAPRMAIRRFRCTTHYFHSRDSLRVNLDLTLLNWRLLNFQRLRRRLKYCRRYQRHLAAK